MFVFIEYYKYIYETNINLTESTDKKYVANMNRCILL